MEFGVGLHIMVISVIFVTLTIKFEMKDKGNDHKTQKHISSDYIQIKNKKYYSQRLLVVHELSGI